MIDISISNAANEQKYCGIGGWLLLFSIAQIIRPLYIVCINYVAFSSITLTDTWHTLTPPGSPGYHALWKPFLIFELTANIITVFLALGTLFLLFIKSRSFVKFWSTSLIISIILIIIDIILSNQFPIADETTFTALYMELISTIFHFALWGTYLKKSKRVKNTFVR